MLYNIIIGMFDVKIKTMEELQFGTGIQGLIIVLVIFGLIWVIHYYDKKLAVERHYKARVLDVEVMLDCFLYTLKLVEWGHIIEIESQKELRRDRCALISRHEGKWTGYTYKIEIID